MRTHYLSFLRRIVDEIVHYLHQNIGEIVYFDHSQKVNDFGLSYHYSNEQVIHFNLHNEKDV